MVGLFHRWRNKPSEVKQFAQSHWEWRARIHTQMSCFSLLSYCLTDSLHPHILIISLYSWGNQGSELNDCPEEAEKRSSPANLLSGCEDPALYTVPHYPSEELEAMLYTSAALYQALRAGLWHGSSIPATTTWSTKSPRSKFLTNNSVLLSSSSLPHPCLRLILVHSTNI